MSYFIDDVLDKKGNDSDFLSSVDFTKVNVTALFDSEGEVDQSSLFNIQTMKDLIAVADQ